MRNFAFAVLALCLLISTSLSAQHTTPRFGTSANVNNTLGGQKASLIYLTDTIGATTDTMQLYPNAFMSHSVITVRDSTAISINVGNSWLGDRHTMIVENTAGTNHVLYLTGKGGVATKWQLASTGNKLSLTTSKRAIMQFVFDGTAWIEVSRLVQ